MIKTDGRPTIAWAEPGDVKTKSKRDTADRPPASELKKLSLERVDCDLAQSA